MAAPDLKVVTLNESNRRQPGPTLRKIADEIEAGKYGEVGTIAIVLLGDTMNIFGAGPESEAPAVALLLNAGALRFAKAIEEHGK